MHLFSFCLIFSLLGAVPGLAFAKEDKTSIPSSSEVLSSKSRDLLYSDRYITTAARNLQEISHVSENVTIITREELNRWPVADLDEALGLVPGLVVQDDGHIGQVATAQIYGSKPRAVRVMVDGITFNATTTGGIADLSQIPLDLVEKIEIIKGPSSSVWGSASGGVIHIITRRTGNTIIPEGTGSISFGEYETYRQRGELWGGIGPLHYYTFGSYVQSDGFRPHSEELEKRSFSKLDLRLTDALLFQGSFGYSGSQIGEFELPDQGIQANRKVYSRYGSGGLIYEPSEDLKFDLFYKVSERSFRRDIELLPLMTPFRFLKAKSLIHEISATSVWDLTEAQRLTLGTDIGLDLYQDASYQLGATRNNVNKESTRHAYFAHYQLSWNSFDWNLGTRLDAVNSYGVNFDPSAGMVYHFPFLNLLYRTNVARAFNAPSLVDRYLSVSTTIANPDLRAETAISYDHGLEATPFPWLHTKAIFFQSFLKDSIETILRSDGFNQPINLSRERRTGFETGVGLGPWQGFDVSYGVNYAKAVGPGGVPVKDRPRLTHDLKLNWQGKWKGFELNNHLAGRYTDLVIYSGFTDPIDQAFIFDDKILLSFPSFAYGRLSLFLEGENLFNEDFSFDGGRDPNPQRNFEAGIQFTIGAKESSLPETATTL